MNYIIRRDPFREMVTLRSAMDRLFDSAFLGEDGDWPTFVDSLPLDVAETEDEYVVKASIPGIKPDDLEITYSGKTLTIKGEFKAEEEKEDVHFHLRERRYGAFARSLSLPASGQVRGHRGQIRVRRADPQAAQERGSQAQEDRRARCRGALYDRWQSQRS